MSQMMDGSFDFFRVKRRFEFDTTSIDFEATRENECYHLELR